MRMTFRWYGENNDNISLQSIKPVSYTHLNEEDWQALLTYLNFYYFGKPLTDDINQKRFAR